MHPNSAIEANPTALSPTSGGMTPRGVMGGEPVMRFTGNKEIEDAREAERAAQEQQNTPVILNLASDIRTKWTAAREAKNEVQVEMVQNLRQRKGEYDPEDLARIQAQGGTGIYINITNVKCRAAESWIYDILLPPGERPWAARPTPIPKIPDDVELKVKEGLLMQFQEAIQMNQWAGIPETPQQLEEQIEQLKDEVLEEIKRLAKEKADELECEIDDDLVEGDWYQAVRDLVPDIVNLPAGILHGPIVRMKKQLKWAQYPDGSPMVQVEEVQQRTFERVSPFDIYPSPGSSNLQKGHFFHHIRFERKDLTALIGVDGFDEEAIRLVLKQYGAGGLREWMTDDITRQQVEGRPPEHGRNAEKTIDCIKFLGPIQGQRLLQWGMDPEQIPDPLRDYEVIAYLVGQYIIGASLNKHPLGKRNYYSSSFEQSNTSIWGKGVPNLMRDIQKICNGCGRSIVNNMSMASGPQVVVLANLLADGENITSIIPWKIWRMSHKGDALGRTKPVEFFQPDSIVDQLLKVYEYFFKQASEVTGIPAYVYGSSDVGGAGKTASGLSMLMNAASKGLKTVVGHIDNGIIRPSIEECWLHIMLYEPEKAGGDIKVVARASEYLIMMEQLQIRRMEYLVATNNPTDIAIIGHKGRAAIHRETVRSLKMPVDDIIPDEKSIEAQVENAKMNMFAANLGAAFGVDPQMIMQIAQGGGGTGPPGGPGGPGPGQSQPTAPDGGRMGGQDFAAMQ